MLKSRFLNQKKSDFILIIILFILALIYFAPLLVPSKMMYGSDWLLSGYTYYSSWAEYVRAHWRFPMWDSYNFSGYPTVVSSGGGVAYPLNILFLAFPVHYAWTLLFVLHIFLAGLGMFLLMREYKLSGFVSSLGAVIFMFSGQLITTTHGGHLGRMIGAVFLPYSFLFLHKAFETKQIKDFIIFGGLTGLFLLGGHSQICYWGMIGVLSYFIMELFHRREELSNKGLLNIGVFFSVGMIVLVLIILIKFLPPALSLGYGARGVTRGYGYSTSWSIPTSELIDLVVPHFSGILTNYWGENFFRLDSRYVGILPLVLLGLAFFYRKEKHLIKYFAWFTAICLLLALGKNTPLFRIYYYLIPMAKKFRGPSMFFFLTTFGIAVLSGFGAQVLIDLVNKRDKETERKVFIFLVAAAGIIMLAAIIVSLGEAGILHAMKSHFRNTWMAINMDGGTVQQKIYFMQKNFPDFEKSLWISLLFFILNGALIIAFLRKKINSQIVFPVLALLLLIDIWSINKKYLSAVSEPEEYFAADEITTFIKERKNLFRVFPFNYEGRSQNSYFQFHGIDNVGGYGANPPGRYQQFIGAGESVMFNPVNFIKYPQLLSMLNVKYIIGPRLPEDLSGYDERVREIIGEYKNFYSNFEVAFVGRKYQVLENRNFIPRFSLVNSYIVVGSPETALNKIMSAEFEKGRVVFLEEKAEFPISESTGEVNVVKNIANERILNVETDNPVFLLVSENYHPDWKCYIDGREGKIYKANYILYGVFVPAGKHEVRFVYESRIFNFAFLFSFIGFMVFLFATASRFMVKRK